MLKLISVIGGAAVESNSKDYEIAYEVGKKIDKSKHALVCGGMTGVMEAVAKGAKDSGVITIGILPEFREEANQFIDIPLVTGLKVTRNSIVAVCADLVIAIAGSLGTMSEAAIALTVGKKVIVVKSTNSDIFANSLMKLAKPDKRSNIFQSKVDDLDIDSYIN
ncbi:TIGR00725 family protein [bacterium]|nr:TIGR00725 family protein [bacterium]